MNGSWSFCFVAFSSGYLPMGLTVSSNSEYLTQKILINCLICYRCTRKVLNWEFMEVRASESPTCNILEYLFYARDEVNSHMHHYRKISSIVLFRSYWYMYIYRSLPITLLCAVRHIPSCSFLGFFFRLG